MKRLVNKPGVVTGAVLIVALLGALILLLDDEQVPPEVTTGPAGVESSGVDLSSLPAAESQAKQERSPDPWLSPEEGRILIARQSEISGMAPLLRPPEEGTEEWYYQGFTATLYADPAQFLERLQALLSRPGHSTEKVAAMRAWQMAGIKPRLDPLHWASTNLQSDATVRAYAIRSLGREAAREAEARLILKRFLETEEPHESLRAQAIYAMLRWAGPMELQNSIDLLFEEESPAVITEAARALQFNGSGAAKAMLLSIQQGHPQEKVRHHLQRILNTDSDHRGRSR